MRRASRLDNSLRPRPPRPRTLTSAEPWTGRGEKTGTPDEIRAFVRAQKAAGADLIKIFAAGSVRRPDPTLSQEQLNAACDGAKKQGLGTLVHAYVAAARAATFAGCTQFEHGVLASDDDLKLMAARGTYLDAQTGLVRENYLRNREKFVGTPGYPATLEGFAGMEALLPVYRESTQRAREIPGLKIVFGSDALAGARGRNAGEFVFRGATAGWSRWRRSSRPAHWTRKRWGCPNASAQSRPALRPTSSRSTATH